MKKTNNLKKIRKDKKINQLELASVLHVKQPTIARYENGVQQLTETQIIELCKYLNVSADYLLGLEEKIKGE